MTHTYLHCICQYLIDRHLFPAGVLLYPIALIACGIRVPPLCRTPLFGFL